MIIQFIKSALSRAKIPILTVAATYFVSVAIGIVMVHSGNRHRPHTHLAYFTLAVNK